MQQSVKFGILGAALALGAPAGLFISRMDPRTRLPASPNGHAREWRQRRREVLYVGTWSLVALIAYGVGLGRRIDRLRVLADEDPLTGLFNSRRFAEQVRRDVGFANRYAEPLSLLLIDVDGLKRVNDTYGHLAGDATLRHVGQCIRRSLRAYDVAARVGGDEFAVVAPRTASPEAGVLRVRLSSNVSATTPLDLPVTVSVRVATLARFDSRPAERVIETLIATADADLYHRKRKRHGRALIRRPWPRER